MQYKGGGAYREDWLSDLRCINRRKRHYNFPLEVHANSDGMRRAVAKHDWTIIFCCVLLLSVNIPRLYFQHTILYSRYSI